MWDFLQKISSARFFVFWAAGVWLCDLCLTVLIIRRVPFTNIDWDTYMSQVDLVLQGQYDYAQLRGDTGPIAYPAGFCWLYGAMRAFGLSISSAQVVFAALYLATLAIVFEIYRLARCPGWLVALCVLSKRVHSVFVLRLFNDGAAQLPLYLALLLFLRGRHKMAALSYSLAVSIKVGPLLYCPAVGLCLVLAGGWSQALVAIAMMFALQLGLAMPFLHANASAYFFRSFGGPGDLQHVWSVNWRMLPESIFLHKGFALGLLLLQVVFLAWFAHMRWIPGGAFSRRIWSWTSRVALDRQAVVCVWFACNFVGVACMRTVHFQFIVWYFHTVPFLAWYAIQPEQCRGLQWVLRCIAVAAVTLAVEVPYLLTTNGTVRGPDGRTWETEGVPTRHGAALLVTTHAVLLVLLARRQTQLVDDKADKSK